MHAPFKAKPPKNNTGHKSKKQAAVTECLVNEKATFHVAVPPPAMQQVGCPHVTNTSDLLVEPPVRRYRLLNKHVAAVACNAGVKRVQTASQQVPVLAG